MKKLAILLTVIAMVAHLQAQQTLVNKEKKSILVAYFSATGTTEGVAKQLAEVTNGTLYQIQPETPYTNTDLDWHDKSSRSSVEMSNPSSRPRIANKLSDMDSYDVVYIGFPIWWNTTPTIINTFIESYDFGGKTIIPFATSGSSSIKKACDDLKKNYPNLKWGEGRLLNNSSRKTLEDFVKQ